MAKRFIKKWFPKPSDVKNYQSLGFMGDLLHNPNLWHLNRRSVSTAFFVGILVAFMPTLGQMIIAAAAAVILRCNLPVSVALVWISNPLTIPPIFYGCYRLGVLILGAPEAHIDWSAGPTIFVEQLHRIFWPLITGCTVAGIFFASLGYFFVRVFWRLHVIRAWNKRRKSRNLSND